MTASRCQRTASRPKSNGTLRCDDPAHGINQPAPAGLPYAEHVAWVVDHAPPLTGDRRATVAALLAPDGADGS